MALEITNCNNFTRYEQWVKYSVCINGYNRIYNKPLATCIDNNLQILVGNSHFVVTNENKYKLVTDAELNIIDSGCNYPYNFNYNGDFIVNNDGQLVVKCKINYNDKSYYGKAIFYVAKAIDNGTHIIGNTSGILIETDSGDKVNIN